ncbi:MAG: VWA domain-containing protein [Acidobacteria bacterium]|nr:VWA domain-containing protein [Acidobacteriota bacterium]
MKKFAIIISLSACLASVAFSQGNTSSRPRVAPTSTPPKVQDDPYTGPDNSGPPVLNGTDRATPKATATPPGGDDEIIKVETNLVTMPVSVLDRDGRFISGLQKNDFQIFENGVQQKVDYFQSTEQPFTVVLLLDVSPSTAFRIDEIQNAAISFVNQLRPGDRVEVIAFDEDVHLLCAPTSDRYRLESAIQQARFGDGTSLYEAVDYTISQQLRTMQGRKAVVLFTDGVDTTSRRASYESTVRDTEEIDALFYTVRYDTSHDSNNGGWNGGGGRGIPWWARVIMGGGVNIGGGGTASSQDYAKGKRYLEQLAENSGGREFEAGSIYNIDAAFSGIAEELRRQYSLGYYPETAGTVGERRQIKIRVMRPNVVVRAKTSYIVGQTNRTLAGR